MVKLIDENTDIKVKMTKAEKEIARAIKIKLWRKAGGVTGYSFIDTTNPVFMRKMGLTLYVRDTTYGNKLVFVYSNGFDKPIFRYIRNRLSTDILKIHPRGTMTECKYPELAYDNKDSLDWKIFDLKIPNVRIESLHEVGFSIVEFYKRTSSMWHREELNMVHPFVAHRNHGVYIHMYRTDKFRALKKSGAIYDEKGRLFMFVGDDTLAVNGALVKNYTETDFFNHVVYLCLVTDKIQEIVMSDGAYKPRSEESRVGLNELFSKVGMEFGIRYSAPVIIDTTKEDESMLNRRNERRASNIDVYPVSERRGRIK